MRKRITDNLTMRRRVTDNHLVNSKIIKALTKTGRRILMAMLPALVEEFTPANSLHRKWGLRH